MPGQHNGLDVCNFIKLNRAYHKTFVALLTAQDNKEDVYIGMESNANLYITKPFNAENIELIVESYLQRRTT
jgi:DNA-binding response OmpR family regulator